MQEGIQMVNVALKVMSLLLTALLVVGMWGSTTLRKRKLLMAAMLVHLAGVSADLLSTLCAGDEGLAARVAVHVGAYVSSCGGIVTAVLVMNYIYSDATARPIQSGRARALTTVLYLINGLTFAVAATNPLTGAYYTVGADNRLSPGPLIAFHGLAYLAQAILMIPVVIMLRHRNKPATTSRLLVCGILVLAVVPLGLVRPDLQLMAPAISLMLALLTVGVQTRLEEDLAAARTEAVESRMRLLSGQIHPHFIFNSLNAIRALVVEDPDAAERAIHDFSDYLRSHLDEMSSGRLISFEEELSHVRHYVSLEMADPSCPMEVRYDLAVTDFSVPPLTLQPLVENAIRHGVRTREGGGVVRVETRRTDRGIEVSVTDNGRGISSATPRQAHRRRVGMRNVRERLERQCGGKLFVSGGGGTTVVTMVLPEGGAHEDARG